MKRMIVLMMISLLAVSTTMAGSELKLRYDVDLTRAEADSFYVHLAVKGISTDSIVFQFASTAPGTYEVEDAGRFVGGFKATDASGKELSVARNGINQFVIRDAKKLSVISYQVDDTYGSPLQSLPGPMSGTSLEKDNALVNGQMVFGYFKGYQSNPIQVAYTYPKDWKVGTALENKKGVYTAETFDRLVDSPILFGKLTTATLKVGGADIEVYCHSQSGKITADSLLFNLKGMLQAADKFIGGLPVKKYAFLYKFTEEPLHSFGAWEHSYSSYYILPEGQGLGSGFGGNLFSIVTSTAAHEFFHIVTPLNIHSEIIAQFNFETPTPSRHLWFYEGTTEWAAQMMQVRSGLISQDELTDRITEKMTFNDNFPPLSLLDLSLGSYGEFRRDYVNIYSKGAITAMMLDIRLLELSKGKTGLREVIQKLAKEYGPKKAFRDEEFFDIFVKMTYPEIADFFNRYIKAAEPLPLKEYLGKAGFDYQAELKTGKFTGTRGLLALDFKEGKLMVTQADSTNEVNHQTGIRAGDELLGVIYGGEEKSLLDPGYQAFKAKMQPGEDFAWKVRRDGNEMILKGKLGKLEITQKHVITPAANQTDAQKEFRSRWLKSL